MADPVQIEIRLREGVWMLTREGDDVRPYGHADEAVHEAVRLAHDLIHTGQPAQVRIEAADGKVIEVDLDEPERVAAPGDDERAAIVPDRGPSA
ncbi:DUF2188 domain-containing protein [Phenylobacterium sp.]|jgi:hypothetical protein|uniref:DUF2188 domain-containing protein n=1 Tax=Phenylobacterium sp. TaxID=1871053 RepID=UPI002E3733CC|nr:DUF2188 domain-containing protein [Phenylobacterium sp.]HEX2561784.1 DUF2188 domain-containing protein [Phenylobacterium sp.]